MNIGNKGIPLSSIPPIPERAVALIGRDWSGWYWVTYRASTDDSHHLLWRGQGETGANYRIFIKEDHFNQFIDALGGLYEPD